MDCPFTHATRRAGSGGFPPPTVIHQCKLLGVVIGLANLLLISELIITFRNDFSLQGIIALGADCKVYIHHGADMVI